MTPRMRAAANRLARGMRHVAARDAERRGTGRYRATVLDTNPLRLDVHGLDLELDADDVTLGRSVTSGPALEVDDVLVLVEVEEHEYIAVDVED